MLRVTLRPSTSRIPIEASCLAPDRLTGLDRGAIAGLPVFYGNSASTIGELFEIDGDASDGRLTLCGDCSIVKWLGHEMKQGEIVVEGCIGMHLGAEMSGGEIIVHEDAGDWVGAEMKGGRIRVGGSAGHLVGGAYRGSAAGMAGGVIVIEGDAGNEVGCGMRRGCIVIGGRCGDFAGAGLHSGSIFVFGPVGIRAGAGMRRGTIVLFDDSEPIEVLPTFRFDCVCRPEFLSLFRNRLCHWAPTMADASLFEADFRRYSGDLLEGGLGEILIRQRCAPMVVSDAQAVATYSPT